MHLSSDSIVSVIRCGLNLDVPNLSLSDQEFSEMIEIGKKQSILPILYHGLKRMDCQKKYIEIISNACNKDMYQYIQQTEALKSIGIVFDHTEIPYIYLKGAVLRNLYPSPEVRTCHDVDILVREDDIHKAINILETNTTFKMMNKGYHDFVLLNENGVQLELHFSIKENVENIDWLLVKAWDYAAHTDSGYRFEFANEFQLFYIAAHMSYHFLNGGLGIRPFLDLWLLRNKTEFDDETVRQMCEDCGILKFYEECCNLSEIWLGNQEYTETAKMLEQFCLSGGVFGSEEFKNAARQRDGRGIKYILSRVFPPSYQVKEYYKDGSGKEHMLPYYYAKRLTSWISKGRRNELNRQVKTIMSSDQSYLDLTEELLSRLGMKKY